MKGGFGCSACGCTPQCQRLGPLGSDSIGELGWRAQMLVAPAGGITVTSVTILVDYNALPLPSSLEISRVQFQIWSDDGATDPVDALPSAHIATLTNPSAFSLPFMTFTSAGVTLTADTRYWLVLGLSQDLTAAMFWNFDQPFLQPPDYINYCPPLPRVYSIDGGIEWLPLDAIFQYMFSIN